MLSWFGAVRMKRKPLWFEEQRHLVRFHAHQDQYQNFITGPHTVKLPSEEQVAPMPMPVTSEGGEKPGDASQSDKTPRTISTSGVVGVETVADHGGSAVPHPPIAVGGGTGSGMTSMGAVPPRPQEYAMRQAMANRAQQQHQQHQQHQQQRYMMTRQPNTATVEQVRMRLKQIEMNQATHGQMGALPPPMYPGITPGMPGMGMPAAANYQQLHRRQQLHAFQKHHQIQQQRQMIQLQRIQQQQHMQQQVMGQPYNAYPQPPVAVGGPGMHAMNRPLQANPPMQMQQVMQQRQGYPPGHRGVGHSGMMAPPTGIPPGRQQYPPQQAGPGMNQVMPRQGMYQ